MQSEISCELCGRAVPTDESFIVRIEVFADPSLPNMSGDELAQRDLDQEMARLFEQMKGLSADDLQDGVHRLFEYRLCGSCQRKYLANPLGKPRRIEAGTN